MQALNRTLDPGMMIVEARGCSKAAATGKLHDKPYVLVFYMPDGKIALDRGYFNPMVTQQTFEDD